MSLQWPPKLLRPPLKATIAVAIASTALGLFDVLGILDLGPLEPWARPLLIIVAVVSGALAIIGVGDYALAPLREKRRQMMLMTRRAIRRKEEEEKLAQRRAAIIVSLDHLSAAELEYVAKCLREGTPTFYTYFFSSPLGALQNKELVWAARGSYNRDYFPHSFHDFVWEALLARKEEFIAKDDENKRLLRDREAQEVMERARRRFEQRETNGRP